MSLEDFFTRLQEHGVRYVVLRWFDTLPHVGEGEDIDLLVADEDLPFVHSLMASRSGVRSTQKFDVYSASGLPGSDFHGVPYYPPRFAREVLADGEWLRGRYRVPSPQHHFDSLAYHAVYHKGHASGLRDGVSPDGARQASDHDYEGVLTHLATGLGRPLQPTLAGLDSYLASRDLRPPLDTLERLEPRNPWIHDHFFAGQADVDDLWQGLAVFVLRSLAAPQVDVAVGVLDREGFEVLDVLELDEEQQARVGHRLRGGNWAQGPWPVSGGLPATYLIAYDVAPDMSGREDNRPMNARIPAVKQKLRDALLAGVPPQERYNPVHSSDNPRQALDYLDALGDLDLAAALRPRVQQLREACTFPYPVVRALGGQARRAQVAVVEHPVHGPAVCKLFRPGAARFFQRELRARTELGGLAPVPDLLEHGDNWVLTTLYRDDGSHGRRRLPGREDVQLTREAARTLARFAAALHDRGLFLLDLSTHNLVTDPAAGLKVLDWEFLQEYPGPVPALADSYTFRGVPGDVPGVDQPQRTSLTRRFGGSVFHPAVSGSTVPALLRSHRLLDRQRSGAVQLAWYLRFLLRSLNHAARSAVGASRWGRDVRAVLRVIRKRLRGS